jgi:hypothetical protein
MFIDRKIELEQLRRLYISDHAELYVLYGRRRVGKTELLRAFCDEKPHLFFIATLSSDNDQLATFSRQVYGYHHPEVAEGFTFPSWESAFRALADLPMQPRPVVVLDEFTYLISGNKAIPSILQKVWDERLKDTQIVLILCGSYIGMMETEILGHQAPLYGRRTASTLLRPLDLASSALFFPNYSVDEQFLAWSVLGGMPYYLRTINQNQDLFSNIRRHILDFQTGTLFSEPRLLLMEELREPRNYFSILRAIAQGRTRLNEIARPLASAKSIPWPAIWISSSKCTWWSGACPRQKANPKRAKKASTRLTTISCASGSAMSIPTNPSWIWGWRMSFWRSASAQTWITLSPQPLRKRPRRLSRGWRGPASWISFPNGSAVGGTAMPRSMYSQSTGPSGSRWWESANGQSMRWGLTYWKT